MCEFASWVEKGRKVYFLTDNQIFGTRKGKELQEWSGNPDDYIGHGAIRFYYGLEQDEGINKECTDFSSPDNFPPVIVKAIKDCKFKNLLIPLPLGLLTALLYSDYRAKTALLDSDYWDLFAIPENRNLSWI